MFSPRCRDFVALYHAKRGIYLPPPRNVAFIFSSIKGATISRTYADQRKKKDFSRTTNVTRHPVEELRSRSRLPAKAFNEPLNIDITRPTSSHLSRRRERERRSFVTLAEPRSVSRYQPTLIPSYFSSASGAHSLSYTFAIPQSSS